MRHARKAVRSGIPRGVFSSAASAGLAAISLLCNFLDISVASQDERSAVTSMFLRYRRAADTVRGSPTRRTDAAGCDRWLGLDNVLS